MVEVVAAVGTSIWNVVLAILEINLKKNIKQKNLLILANLHITASLKNTAKARLSMLKSET
jgi:hypothetical protein